jgi:hypothetical protein
MLILIHLMRPWVRYRLFLIFLLVLGSAQDRRLAAAIGLLLDQIGVRVRLSIDFPKVRETAKIILFLLPSPLPPQPRANTIGNY